MSAHPPDKQIALIAGPIILVQDGMIVQISKILILKPESLLGQGFGKNIEI